MIETFRKLVMAPDLALEPSQLNRVRSLQSHFFNEDLFSCAGEFNETYGQDVLLNKLAFLENLGLGLTTALRTLAHLTTELSTTTCAKILSNIESESIEPTHKYLRTSNCDDARTAGRSAPRCGQPPARRLSQL